MMQLLMMQDTAGSHTCMVARTQPSKLVPRDESSRDTAQRLIRVDTMMADRKTPSDSRHAASRAAERIRASIFATISI